MALAVESEERVISKQPALLTMQDVCDRLGLLRAAVRRLMREEGLRYVKVGKEFRFRPEWVEEFIDRDAHSAPPRRGRKR